jgi:hypothetical protein
LLRFLQAFGSRKGALDYPWYFDYDDNGVVGVVDLIQFVQRLGK